MKNMKSEFKEGRWGEEFENGKLYSFDDQSVVVIRAWPPAAWRRCEENGWRRCSDVEDFVLRIEHSSTLPGPEPPPPRVIPNDELIALPTYESQFSDEENLRIWHACECRNWAERRKDAAFWAPVPVAIRDAVSQYTYGRWRMLTLLTCCPQALDLHQSNPALLFALAHQDQFRQSPVRNLYRAVRRLVGEKQKKILGWLGFPATEAARKLFRKIPAGEVSVDGLRYLRELLSNPRLARMASHLPRLCEDLIRIFIMPELLATIPMKLLFELSTSEFDEAHTVVSGFEESRQLGLPWPRRLRSLGEAGGLCAYACWRGEGLSVAGHHSATWDDETLGLSFPEPPLRGTSEIVPIRSAAELAEEGKSMKHCANVFRGPVLEGKAYVYRVLAPIRATLSIVKDSKGWQRDLCGGFDNQPVAPEVMETCFKRLFAAGG